MGGYRARSGIAPQTPRHTDGGRQNPTHRSSADTLHVSARSMWPGGSHRFCTSITCRPSEAALDGPGPAAVKASVDEGMSSREASSSVAGAPVQLSESEIAVDLESSAR